MFILEFLKKEWRKTLVVGGVQVLMGYAHMLAFKRTSILFAVILGCLILKESSFKLRFSAALFMLLGIFVITFFGK